MYRALARRVAARRASAAKVGDDVSVEAVTVSRPVQRSGGGAPAPRPGARPQRRPGRGPGGGSTGSGRR